MKYFVHIVGSMAPGGIENFIMNIYRNIDREKIQFHFILNMKKEVSYDEEIESMGGKIYYVTRKAENPIKNFLEVRKIIREQKYDTVCRHSDNAFTVVDLLAAKLAGTKRIIMHSHSTQTKNSGLHKFFRLWFPYVTTHRFACSKTAGKWMYGNKDFQVVPNAIDTDKFLYSESIRNKMRKEWNVEDAHVYGHVGSFVYAKNHPFLLDVFHEISKQDEKAVLFLVGDGDLRKEAEEKVKEYGLEKKVIFTGRRMNVPDFLQMFDVLLFPSVYEGLPVSLVEAQTSGLQCLISDRITDEVILTDCARNYAIDLGAESWAKKAMEVMEKAQNTARESKQEKIKEVGYDIHSLTKFYENF